MLKSIKMCRKLSQSLSIRAMSFDRNSFSSNWYFCFVSIPFDQGNVFRPITASIESTSRTVSIPFDQGNVFRLLLLYLLYLTVSGLNPFRSGQCLSTIKKLKERGVYGCLNPFRSGQCLSTAAICWRQELCGLSDPLPNFFGRLRSWLLI